MIFNMEVDLAPFGRWTLRDNAAQRGHLYVERQLPSKLNGCNGSSRSFPAGPSRLLSRCARHWTVDAVLSNARAVEHLMALPAGAK
jgi:hypothetical protein